MRGARGACEHRLLPCVGSPLRARWSPSMVYKDFWCIALVMRVGFLPVWASLTVLPVLSAPDGLCNALSLVVGPMRFISFLPE